MHIKQEHCGKEVAGDEMGGNSATIPPTSFRIRALCRPTVAVMYGAVGLALLTILDGLLRATFPRIGRNLIFRSLLAAGTKRAGQ